MNKLSRMEVAAIKRTASNVKGMRKKRAKLEIRLAELAQEIENLDLMIEDWEAPVRRLTGGMSSEEYLSGVETTTEVEGCPENSNDNTTIEEPEEEPWV